jgi:hypothetical protein
MDSFGKFLKWSEMVDPFWVYGVGESRRESSMDCGTTRDFQFNLQVAQQGNALVLSAVVPVCCPSGVQPMISITGLKQ